MSNFYDNKHPPYTVTLLAVKGAPITMESVNRFD